VVLGRELSKLQQKHMEEREDFQTSVNKQLDEVFKLIKLTDGKDENGLLRKLMDNLELKNTSI
jgi:hypothetical protein